MKAHPDDKLKRPSSKWEWVGLIVKNTRPLRNGWVRVPVGTELLVERSHRGLHIIGRPCSRCGVTVTMNRVSESDVYIDRRACPAPGPTLSLSVGWRDDDELNKLFAAEVSEART